jgi:DNA repair protein RecO (recombination protein O)
LVRLDQFEILWSPLAAPVDYLRTAGLQLVVEVLEEAMPELAADDNIYRLAVTCLTAMSADAVWLPVTYFCLWMSRLMGWMPELGHCAVCGLDLRPSPAQSGTVWWSPAGDGVTCHDDRRPTSHALSAESVRESYGIARTPLVEMAAEAWPVERASDLRAFAIGMLERHLERRLRSAAALLPR